MKTDSLSAVILDVSVRAGLDPYSFARPDDFTVSRTSPCRLDDPAIAELQPMLVPYAVDRKTRQILCTVHPSRRFAANHAFLYQAQREHAEKAVLLPVSVLAGMFRDEGTRPTFLFSVGRCGSTLAADLLGAVGISIASEPGVYDQFVTGRRWPSFDRSFRSAAMVATTRALSSFLGAPMVVKLRAQCTFIAPAIAAATRGRCVVILRALEPWAKSTYRVFGNRPDELAWMYAKAVKIVDALERQGYEPQLVWYEDMARDPRALLRAVGADEALLTEREEALAATYRRDSQEGMSIGRSGSNSAMSEEAFEEFMRLWAKHAPRKLLERSGIAERL